jgi:hypothetical protein
LIPTIFCKYFIACSCIKCINNSITEQKFELKRKENKPLHFHTLFPTISIIRSPLPLVFGKLERHEHESQIIYK